VKPCLYLTDTTTEALRKALQEHGSVGLLSAEGSSIVESFGRYNGGNKGADMALFLAAHAGDPDKGGRVSGTHGVREALASMGITAQPDVLQTIGRDRMARGRGMVDRFLFLIPQDPRGSRTYRNQPKLSPVIENKWAKIIRRIIQVETQETIPCAGVDEDAADAWLDFAQDIEDRQAQGGDLRAMAGFASKLAGAVGRIALAYHFAQGRNADSSIDTATMLQAIGTGIAMIDHARAAMQMMGEDETTARARLVAEGIARHGLESVKPWEIASKHLGGCKTAEEARTACHKLAEHGYLIAIEQATDKQGRKPKDAYSVHPALFSHFSHFSQAEDSEDDLPLSGIVKTTGATGAAGAKPYAATDKPRPPQQGQQGRTGAGESTAPTAPTLPTTTGAAENVGNKWRAPTAHHAHHKNSNLIKPEVQDDGLVRLSI